MENFDDLTNDQIRLKLLEYGLPNIPVTSTSRKVLIKKLKNHVENANSKVRRETIHVAKYSSDEDIDNGTEEPKKTQKKEPNRRATIGGSAAKLSKTLPVMPSLPKPTEKVDPSQKRRSGRLTPVQQSKDDGAITAPKEPMIIENSEGEDDEMPLTQVRTRDRKSKSKSPSLSRAEMVTTSYIHQKGEEKVSKPTIPEEMEIDLTESTDDLRAVEPEPAPLIRPQLTPSREARFTSTTTSNISKRTTIGGPSSGTFGLSQQNRPTSQDLSSSFGRPSVSTFSYQSPQPTRREDMKLDPTDSPYLSEFTKRLSRLKAESVGAARDQPTRRTIGSTSYAPSPAVGAGGGDYVQSRLATARGVRQREAAPGGQGEIRASLRQVILALDQKYSFKKLFYTLIIALIVVFLFVFFFM